MWFFSRTQIAVVFNLDDLHLICIKKAVICWRCLTAGVEEIIELAPSYLMSFYLPLTTLCFQIDYQYCNLRSGRQTFGPYILVNSFVSSSYMSNRENKMLQRRGAVNIVLLLTCVTLLCGMESAPMPPPPQVYIPSGAHLLTVQLLAPLYTSQVNHKFRCRLLLVSLRHVETLSALETRHPCNYIPLSLFHQHYASSY